MKIERKRLFETVLLVAVLAFSFNQVYRVHYGYTGLVQDPHNDPKYLNVEGFSYPYPIHADEWTHLAQAVYIMESGTLGFVNPYSPNLEYHRDLELGYHMFLALFLGASGLDPVLSYQYLPALFFTLNSLFLFLFVRRFTKNYYIALLSIVFFLIIPSNTNIMGNWFAIPLTFSVFLIYAFFLLFDRFLEKNERKYLICSAALYLLSALTYPFATILISLIVMIHLLLGLRVQKKEFLKKNRLSLSISGLALLLLALIIVYFPEQSLFSRAWTAFQYDYSLIFFYGLLPTSLAAIGFLIAIKKNMNRIFIIWPVLFLLNLLSYKISGSGLFFPYERTIYYFLLGFAPLAATGFYHVLMELYKILHTSLTIRHMNYISLALALAFFFITLNVIFQGYYEIKEKDLVLLYLLEGKDYEAIKFIGDAYGGGHVVLADHLVSAGIYPISRNHVVAITPGQLSYGDTGMVKEYFSSDCGQKFSILADKKAEFVLGRESENCFFLKEIYSSGVYVYRVTA